MKVGMVHVIAAGQPLGFLDVETAAGIIFEISGMNEVEAARDLRGGIALVCGWAAFVPDAVAHLNPDQRSTRRLSPVERAPFPAGRKA